MPRRCAYVAGTNTGVHMELRTGALSFISLRRTLVQIHAWRTVSLSLPQRGTFLAKYTIAACSRCEVFSSCADCASIRPSFHYAGCTDRPSIRPQGHRTIFVSYRFSILIQQAARSLPFAYKSFECCTHCNKSNVSLDEYKERTTARLEYNTCSSRVWD